MWACAMDAPPPPPPRLDEAAATLARHRALRQSAEAKAQQEVVQHMAERLGDEAPELAAMLRAMAAAEPGATSEEVLALLRRGDTDSGGGDDDDGEHALRDEQMLLLIQNAVNCAEGDDPSQKLRDLVVELAAAEGIVLEPCDDDPPAPPACAVAPGPAPPRPPAPSTSVELHEAVFRHDFRAVRSICRRLLAQNDARAAESAATAELEHTDARGNTPLLLATKLGRTDIASFLVHQGANVDVHSDEHFHLIDEAVATGDREFVKLIHQRMQLRAYARFVARRPALLETLRTAVPDFYLEMKWDCACSGVLSPLVRAMGLSDTYHIWKRGSQLRIDSSVVGVGKGRGPMVRLKRGSLSLLFIARGDGAGPTTRAPPPGDDAALGELWVVDHGKQTFDSLLRRLHSPSEAELERAVRKLMKAQQPGKDGGKAASRRAGATMDSVDVGATTFRFAPIIDKRGAHATATVGPWDCRRYRADGDVQLVVHRKQTTAHSAALREMSFEHYLAGELPPASRRLRQLRKRVKGEVQMAPSFPLTLAQIMPALTILAMKDAAVERLQCMLEQHGVPQDEFPVKATVPLMLGVQAVVTFEKFSPSAVAGTHFDIPPEYVLQSEAG